MHQSKNSSGSRGELSLLKFKNKKLLYFTTQLLVVLVRAEEAKRLFWDLWWIKKAGCFCSVHCRLTAKHFQSSSVCMLKFPRANLAASSPFCHHWKCSVHRRFTVCSANATSAQQRLNIPSQVEPRRICLERLFLITGVFSPLGNMIEIRVLVLHHRFCYSGRDSSWL